MRSPTLFLCACLSIVACGHEAPAPPPGSTRPVAVQASPPLPHVMPDEATTPSRARDHSTIRYRVYGSGEPAILLIHGWSCDSGYWDAQLDELGKQHTVVTIDLAGHGRSDAQRRKDWSMANFGADVAAVIDALGQPRVVLVGHSMGGTVALEAARQRPSRVIGIVGVDTLRDLGHPYPKEVFEPLLQGLRNDFVKATADLVEQRFFTDRFDPVVRRWIVRDMSAAPLDVAIPALEQLLAVDYAPIVADLDIPIVVINADQPPTDEAAIRRLEPRFRVVTMTGVGHFLMMEKPAQFNRMLSRIVEAWTGPDPRHDPPLSPPAPTR